jgi:predicted transcriptional regulator
MGSHQPASRLLAWLPVKGNHLHRRGTRASDDLWLGFTFRVDEELKSAFTRVAAAQERTAAQLLRVVMREAVQQWDESQAHDAWFRGEVEQALTEAVVGYRPATPAHHYHPPRRLKAGDRAADGVCPGVEGHSGQFPGCPHALRTTKLSKGHITWITDH